MYSGPGRKSDLDISRRERESERARKRAREQESERASERASERERHRESESQEESETEQESDGESDRAREKATERERKHERERVSECVCERETSQIQRLVRYARWRSARIEELALAVHDLLTTVMLVVTDGGMFDAHIDALGALAFQATVKVGLEVFGLLVKGEERGLDVGPQLRRGAQLVHCAAVSAHARLVEP